MSAEDQTEGPTSAPKGLSEDWLATILGLILLLLSIAGIIPAGLVP